MQKLSYTYLARRTPEGLVEEEHVLELLEAVVDPRPSLLLHQGLPDLIGENIGLKAVALNADL